MQQVAGLGAADMQFASNAGAITMSASLQMAECWHQISMAARFFASNVLLSMEIDALAASDPEMLIRNLENGEPPRKSGPELQKRRNTMDDPNNPTSGTPYGQAEGGTATAARRKLSDTAAEVKDKVAEFGRKTVDNLDESRKSTAGALHQAAAKLHSGGEQVSGAAHAAAHQISGVAHDAADKLHAAADYIHDTDVKRIGEDLKDIVKRYPGPALAVAAVLGFLVARGFRRD